MALAMHYKENTSGGSDATWVIVAHPRFDTALSQTLFYTSLTSQTGPPIEFCNRRSFLKHATPF